MGTTIPNWIKLTTHNVVDSKILSPLKILNSSLSFLLMQLMRFHHVSIKKDNRIRDIRSSVGKIE